MSEFIDCVFTQNGMAFGVAAALFLLTIFLAGKRAIGLFATIIFLAISLVAGIGIKHKTEIYNFFADTETGNEATTDTTQALLDKLEQAYEGIKAEVSKQSENVQNLLNDSERDK